MNDIRPSIPSNDEEKYRNFRNKEIFQEKFEDMHSKIKSIDSRVCEDGKCTKEQLEHLRKDFSAHSTELAEIKKQMDHLKHIDDLKKEIIDIKKEIPKLEVCPECSEKSVLHLSSHCSNCGVEIPEWTDDNGIPIANWKPFQKRIEKRR